MHYKIEIVCTTIYIYIYIHIKFLLFSRLLQFTHAGEWQAFVYLVRCIQEKSAKFRTE